MMCYYLNVQFQGQRVNRYKVCHSVFVCFCSMHGTVPLDVSSQSERTAFVKEKLANGRIKNSSSRSSASFICMCSDHRFCDNRWYWNLYICYTVLQTEAISTVNIECMCRETIIELSPCKLISVVNVRLTSIYIFDLNN